MKYEGEIREYEEYEGLSRRDLGEIQKLHDEQDYKCITGEQVTAELKKIGLPRHASRLEVAMRIKEIEWEMDNA